MMKRGQINGHQYNMDQSMREKKFQSHLKPTFYVILLNLYIIKISLIKEVSLG